MHLSIIEVLFFAFASVLGIIIGTTIGIYKRFTHKTISKTMAFAAGLLIAAATIELAVDAAEKVNQFYFGIFSLMIGAIGFSFGNALLSNKGAKDRKRCGECVAQPSEKDIPGSGLAITLGTGMDAVPEAIVLGLTLFTHGVNTPLILAIALGNLPEAISGSVGMLAAGRAKKWVIKVWGGVTLGTILLTVLGFLFAGQLSENMVSNLQLFGAGALIAMVSETLIPEAFHGTPKYSGTIVTLGFALLLIIKILTRDS
ncbi:ZIP family metal transporter [Adhaeribacter terreus]|uniref:ZIP family metal transporter n=1 Tax=Adhaeribacter terreus TaxID=529703 RepID=A0ABW0E6G0_9BACT